MDKVIVKDLELFCYHGVNPEEKIDGQIFVFDIEAGVDLSKPCMTDNVDDTVSYAKIIKTVRRVAQSEKNDLIERVAQRVVDELFNDYLRRPGFVEPLAAKFCNGTTVTCEGLSQWGSQNLAQQGYSSTRILRSYYGDVEIVNNAPIQGITTSYPGTPLRRGTTGPSVVTVQVELNRISQSYPAIPKISPVDGIFGAQTEAAVRKFQEIFNLTVDGVVGRSTWYALVRYYIAVTRLAELRSQGQRFYTNSWATTDPIEQGDRGIKVEHLQYMLNVLSAYIPEIPSVTIDGIFGAGTRAAVIAAQRRFNLPQTGIVNAQTWDEIYDQFSGIETTSWRDPENFPYTSAVISGTQPRTRYSQTSTMTQFPGRDLRSGNQDPIRQEAPR